MEALCFRRSQPPVIKQAVDDVQVEEEEEEEEGAEEKMIDVEPKNGLKGWMKRESETVKTITELRGERGQRELKSDDSERGSLTEIPRRLNHSAEPLRNGSPSHTVTAPETSSRPRFYPPLKDIQKEICDASRSAKNRRVKAKDPFSLKFASEKTGNRMKKRNGMDRSYGQLWRILR